MSVSRQFRLATRPVGLPRREDFEYREEEVGEPGDGEIAVAVTHISLDPAMRGWMNEGRSYIAPVRIGDVMRAGVVGEVVASRSDVIAVGDHVLGMLGAQTFAIVPATGVLKIDTSLAEPPVYLGALGLTGQTAYLGLMEIGKPQPGETVVVSGAAGAVGSVAGQIAKITGARAVGIAGGPEKCRHVVEDLGFDAAIDYKGSDVAAELKRNCPDGIDVYFDNVGGEILDAALAQLAKRARVVICGAISQYNATEGSRGPANYMSLLVNNASMTGFTVFDYADRLGAASSALAGWLRDGRLVHREQIVDGFDAFPETLLMLFSGANTGKLVLAV